MGASEKRCKEANMEKQKDFSVRKLLNRVYSLLICMAIVSTITACTLSYTYTFTNQSSYTVSVRPDKQSSWNAFDLANNSVRAISIPETTILYIYGSSDQVKDVTGPNSITFQDR